FSSSRSRHTRVSRDWSSDVCSSDLGPESTWPFTDGLTATGVVARRGVVAVDPTVIPLGSHLYIPGYGLGIAADVGAAIKGNRIDVLYEDLDDALRWGRKWVKVYILDE